MKRSSLRRVLTSFLAVVFLISSVFVSDVVYTQEIAAETKGSNAAENEAEAKSQVGSVENNYKEEDIPGLVEDSQDSSMYYNSNSSIRDFRDETIYFVMTTRFYDGDSSNNVQCWDAKDKNEGDPPWRGDFKGLIDKLDYIKALGFTAVWITPVVENASGYDYHGYHAINFSKVDPRYESDGCTYQDLIDAIHDKGMKVIQDVVFNHTGNWGEGNLYPIASKDYTKDISDCEASMVPNYEFKWDDIAVKLGGSKYVLSKPQIQFETRTSLLMGAEYDTNNIYHHNGYIKSWETYDEQITSIAGDCIDLNTENPTVYKYLVDAYGSYIKMGVDAFRVDTVKHVSRLTFNNALISQLNDVYNEVHGTTGEGNFYMFGEVCTRVRGVWNRDIPALSCPFYTWKESKEYAWDDSETAAAIATNEASVKQAFQDNLSLGSEPTSNNALLDGNNYHSTDYSKASGMNVIDFPMHWNFNSARDAFNVAVGGDKYYNDATYNVTYVDSHDYAPDGAPENQRFAGSTEQWAENLSLMFTFRGIPCIYYGSEVEFQKGCPIDVGTTKPLAETGRAYFGDYIEGSVDVVDFARYSNATGKMAETLNHPLSLHIQRLNRLRAAIPALRKGQYSTEGCSGQMSYKRRYTDDTTDSFALIAITSDATFTGIPNGTYTDAITGDVQNVTGGSLSTSGIKGQGDLRVYVLDTDLTKAPGMIDGRSDYMSGGGDVVVDVVKPTGISLDKTSAELDLGDTVKFTATVTPADATSKTVTWKSSDTTVASVNGSGLVTAKGEGTATIYAATSNATSADYDNKSGLVATATVTVKASGIRVTDINLSQTSVVLDGGEAVTIKATVLPPNASPNYAKITWTSSDTAVAKVSSTGVITGIKQGKATITATTMDGVSATVDVEVKGTVIYGNAIYFEKPSDWGNNIKVYMWSEDNTWKNAEWPGVSMSLIDEAKGVYGIEWPEGKSNINAIFSDGNNQTDDLKNVKMNGYYKISGLVEEVSTNPIPDTPAVSSEDKSSEDKSSEDKSSEDKSSEDKSSEDKSSEDKSSEDKSSEDKSSEDKSSEDKSSEDKSSEDKSSEDKSSEDKSSEDQSTEDKSSEDQSTEDKSSEDQSSEDKSSEDQSSEDKSSEDQSSEDKSSEDKSSEEQTTAAPVKELKVKSFTVTVASGMLEKGKTVKLKASASNAQGTAKYRFVVKINGVTSIIKNYSTNSSVNWKPSKAGKYTLTVYVKDNYKVVKKSISNYVVNDVLKITKFKTSVASKKAVVGKTVKLSAKATGGTKKYSYKYVYKLGKSTKTISGYNTKTTVSWKPKKAGTYTLTLYVKDVKTGKVVKKTISKYVVK